jgi:hypothetical protein
MLKVQLFVQGERVDMFQDETIKITKSLKNIKDVAKIFTAFTQTFTLPASKKNNKLFKHYYNFNIEDGYDARERVNAEIQVNNITFEKGKLQLNGVQLSERKPANYKVTFYGATVELKDLIGEDKLSSLPLDSYSKLYGPGAVLGGLSQNFIDGGGTPKPVITPLITHTKRLYYSSTAADSFDQSGNLKPTNDPDNAGNYKQGLPWTQLKYAINVNVLIQAIETKYSTPAYPVNLRFSNDFFNNPLIPKMNNLYMWLHRKSGHVENLSGNEETITPVDDFDSIVTTPIIGADNNPDNGFFSDGQLFFITSPGSGGFPINFSFTQFKIEVNVPPSETDTYRVRMFANLDDTPVFVSSQVTGDQTFTWNPSSPSTNPSDIDDFLYLGSVLTFDIVAANVINVSEFKVTCSYYGGKVIGNSGGTQFFNFASSVSAGPFSTASVFRFNITQQIPELKTIDLLSGLFKMFNLVAFVDTENSSDTTKNIIVKPLDDYYANPARYEIDEYIDITKEVVNVALPYKKVLFKYKDSKSFLAERYRQLANKGWGELSYTEATLKEIGGQLYKVEVPFGHFQFERLTDPANGTLKDIQWGWSVNESRNSYKGAPLLFYPIFQNIGAYNVGSVVDSENPDQITTVTQRSYANIPSNSLRISASQGGETLHFGHEINEYTQDTSFTGSLFNEEYTKYIKDIFNRRRRIIKIKAYLPLKILLNYSLSDKFIYKQEEYNINSISTNLTTGESDIELINCLTYESYD